MYINRVILFLEREVSDTLNSSSTTMSGDTKNFIICISIVTEKRKFKEENRRENVVDLL